MIKLSVVIITFNEEKNIKQCLQAAECVADELIVLDSFSTDKTQQICESFNVKFYQQAFTGYIDQKNKALTYASYQHILSIDADEVLSCELLKSIRQIKENWQADGYYFNRLTNYCGSWIRHCDWYPDRKLRMWDIKKGQWDGLLIHEKVLLEQNAKTEVLQGDLLHYSYYSIDQHLDQIRKFTSIMAQENYQRRKNPGIGTMIIKPGWKFIRSYIIFGGFRDGFYGFVICVLSAYATFIKYIKTRELFINENLNR